MSTSKTEAETAFNQFYLQQATKEFSEDIDKLRAGPDFKVSNIPVLVEALQQGISIYGESDRVHIGEQLLANKITEQSRQK